MQLEAGKCGARLMRNNRGLFLTLDGKRKIRAGLEADKSGDFIGWTQIEITPEMIGKKIAVYTEIEIKKELWTKPSNPHERKQATRLDAVRKFGGIAGFVNKKEKLKKVIDSCLSSW